MEISASDFSGINLADVETRVVSITLNAHIKKSDHEGIGSIHKVVFLFRLNIMINKRFGISGPIESLFNLKVGNSMSPNLAGYEQLDFGFFIRKACFNLYSTDDPRMIDLIQSSRIKMGIDGDHDVIEIINEAQSIVEKTLFTVQKVDMGLLVPIG